MGCFNEESCDECAAEIARLNLELQKRDKCSYMGPMRDCPTHGDSAEIAQLREALDTIAKVSDDMAIVTCAKHALTHNAKLTGSALLRSPS